MALTPKQPSGQRNYDDLLRRVRALETRRVLPNASINSGGIYVKAPAPAVAGSIHLWVATQEGTSQHDATLDFQPSEATLNPAKMVLQDDGPGNTAADYPLRIASVNSPSNTAGTATVSLAPGAISLVSSSTANVRALYLTDGQPAQLNGWKIDAATLDSATNSLRWQAASGEWQAKNTSGAFVAIRGSSFPTSSSRGAKQNVTELPFDPAAVIKSAQAWQWEYKPERASDTDRHISPMADDLPDALVRGEGDDRTVDTRDLVGVLWAACRQMLDANQQLADRVGKLETAVKKLTTTTPPPAGSGLT